MYPLKSKTMQKLQQQKTTTKSWQEYMESVLCWPNTPLGQGRALKCVVGKPSDTPLKKSKIPFPRRYHLPIGTQLEMNLWVYFPSKHWILSALSLVFMHASFERHMLILNNLCSSSSTSIPEPWGIPIRTEHSKVSHFSNIIQL